MEGFIKGETDLPLLFPTYLIPWSKMSSLSQVHLKKTGVGGPSVPPSKLFGSFSSSFLQKMRVLFSSLLFLCLFNLPFSEALKEISLTAGFFLSIVYFFGTGNLGSFWRFSLRTGWPLYLFTGVSFLSGLHSINRMEGLRGFWGDFEALMGFLFFGTSVALRKWCGIPRIWMTGALLLGTLAGAGVGIARIVIEHRSFLGMMNLGDKNSTAQFLAILMVIILFLGIDGLQREKRDRFSLFLLSVLPVLAIFLFLTRSRTFLVAVPLAFLLMIIIAKAWRALIVLGGILGIGALAAYFVPIIRWEVQTLPRPTSDGSFVSRYPTWEGAIRMWKSHPFLGVGPDNFHMANIHALYHLPEYASHGHNLFFNLLGEYGSLGVAAFALWLAVWCRDVFAGLRTKRLGNSHAALCAGILVLLFVGGIAHPMWGGSTSLMLMLSMVLSLGPLYEDAVGSSRSSRKRDSGFTRKNDDFPAQPEGVR